MHVSCPSRHHHDPCLLQRQPSTPPREQLKSLFDLHSILRLLSTMRLAEWDDVISNNPIDLGKCISWVMTTVPFARRQRALVAERRIHTAGAAAVEACRDDVGVDEGRARARWNIATTVV